MFDTGVDVDGGSFTVGAIVGLVLGVLFVVTIVIIILVLFARRKKWKRAVKDNTSAERARLFISCIVNHIKVCTYHRNN